MGFDAFVFCDCYEKGRLKRLSPDARLVCLLPNGDLGCRSNKPEALDRFDAWRLHACRHEQGMIAGAYLGNMWHVDRLRVALLAQRRVFPVLLTKVLYCGTHTGDHLTLRNVAKLAIELEHLKSFRAGEKSLDKHLQALRHKLQRLVRVSLKIRNPIAF